MTSDIGLTTSKQLVLVSHYRQESETNVNPSEVKKRQDNEDYITTTTTATTPSNVQNGQVRHLEPRPFRPFKSSEEYLYAMKEDLAEWLNALYNLNITVDNFMEKLETGVILCRHANNIIRKARASPNNVNQPGVGANLNQGSTIPTEKELSFRADVNPGTFHARDNVSNFIAWCRKLGIMECLLFETDDLVLRKNEKSFILCLLEIARQGTKIGMIAPMLVQLEQEIDREIAQDAQSAVDEKLTPTTAKDNSANSSSNKSTTSHSSDENKENRKDIESLKNLHEMVVDILSRCSCPSAFPMVKVADGKYRIGDTKVLIFVRILRNHVMVRVGGGWDTLGHYLDRHDPCRCRAGHRFSTSAKVTFTNGGDPSTGPQMVVTYNRPEDPVSTPMGQVNGNSINNAANQMINRATINQSPNHNLKRRASVTTTDYLNGGGNQPIVATPNVNTNGKCGNGRLARRDSITNHQVNHTNEITPRFPSSISTSSTLSSSSSTSSTGYPDGLLLDRQESRTSHYSDDSTDTSSVTMESPSPTQQLVSQSDDGDHQQSSTTTITSTSLQDSSSSTTTTIGKTINSGSTTIRKTRGNYHDSSSSEFSESEINHNSGNNLLGGSSRRRCSPRKIMKTSDLLGTEKPSWASDDFTLDDKESLVKPDVRDSRIDRVTSANVSSSPFQRNCRYRRSEQKMSTRGGTVNGFVDKVFPNGSDGGSKNKSRSSEDLSQVNSSSSGAAGKMSWKNPINGRIAPSISSSPARKITSPKRVISETGKETPMSCFERGRNYYASLPRSRSTQSSRTPLTTDHYKAPHSTTTTTTAGPSPFIRGSPGRYSLNTPRGSLPESISLGSCRSDRFGYGSSSLAGGRLSRQNSTERGETIRTWAFKSRTRPALDADLFNKPCDSSRSSFRYGHRPMTTTTTTPGQRSRSSDSSPSRVPLHTLVKVTNGSRSIVTSKPSVKLLNQFNDCDVNKSSSMVSGDANNNHHHFNEGKDFNDNNTNENTVTNHNVDDDDDNQLITLQNDILKEMETLVNKYQTRIERATPCKIVDSSESINLEADCDGKFNESVINCSHQKCNSSKIPMPIRATPRKES